MPPTGMSVAAYGACSPAQHQGHAEQTVQQVLQGPAAAAELRSNQTPRHKSADFVLAQHLGHGLP